MVKKRSEPPEGGLLFYFTFCHTNFYLLSFARAFLTFLCLKMFLSFLLLLQKKGAKKSSPKTKLPPHQAIPSRPAVFGGYTSLENLLVRWPAKRAEPFVFALIFLVLFASRQKEQEEIFHLRSIQLRKLKS